MNRNRNTSRSSSQSSQSSKRESYHKDSYAQPSKRLFVGGISPSVQESDLRDIFEEIGTIRDIFLKKSEGKNSFCFIEYGTIEEANQAIDQLNGKRVGERAIFVKYSMPKTKKEGQEERKPKFGGGGGGGGYTKGFGGGDRRDRGNGFDRKRKSEEKGERQYQKRGNDKFGGNKGGYGQGRGDYQKHEKPNNQPHHNKADTKQTFESFDY